VSAALSSMSPMSTIVTMMKARWVETLAPDSTR
jgi:hypothetical protein